MTSREDVERIALETIKNKLSIKVSIVSFDQPDLRKAVLSCDGEEISVSYFNVTSSTAE